MGTKGSAFAAATAAATIWPAGCSTSADQEEKYNTKVRGSAARAVVAKRTTSIGMTSTRRRIRKPPANVSLVSPQGAIPKGIEPVEFPVEFHPTVARAPDRALAIRLRSHRTGRAP